MGKDFFRLEAAYTRVPNNLIEAIISYPFNATEHKVVWFVIWMSYGWNSDMTFISY